MHKFEDLKVWNKAMELTTLVYELVKSLPEDEKYGLSSQIKRCDISIPSNIAEGAGRNTDKEFLYFLSISLGSSYELMTQIYLIERLNFKVNIELTKQTIDLIKEIQSMNSKFQLTLKNRIKEN
jgi:four helix bundle protein